MQSIIDAVKRNWKAHVAWAIVLIGTVLANKYLGTNIVPPDVPPFATGWQADPAAVEQVASEMRFKVFSDTPAGQSDDPLPDHFYLWETCRKLDPSGPHAKNQGSVGSCVSFGTNWAVYMTMAADIVINQRNFELKDIAEEVTYAGSRVEVGGGRISGDGSVGAWAAKFVQTYGVVARGVHKTAAGKTYDLSTYDIDRCRTWGRSGVPDDLETVAREHPVQATTRITSWAEFKRAISQGYGVAICSNQGFRMQRDSRGICTPQGSWAHCVSGDGFHKDESGQEYGHIQNSWGSNAHTGPVGWGEPNTGGFWASSSVITRMIAAGDTWAFSSVRGFPARKLEWFVNAPARRNNHALPLPRLFAAVPEYRLAP